MAVPPAIETLRTVRSRRVGERRSRTAQAPVKHSSDIPQMHRRKVPKKNPPGCPYNTLVRTLQGISASRDFSLPRPDLGPTIVDSMHHGSSCLWMAVISRAKEARRPRESRPRLSVYVRGGPGAADFHAGRCRRGLHDRRPGRWSPLPLCRDRRARRSPPRRRDRVPEHSHRVPVVRPAKQPRRDCVRSRDRTHVVSPQASPGSQGKPGRPRCGLSPCATTGPGRHGKRRAGGGDRKTRIGCRFVGRDTSQVVTAC